MPYTMKFIVMVCAAFFARVKPVSTSAKPACMNITRNPATSVQTKLMATVLASMSPSGVRGVSGFVHNMHVSAYTVQHITTITRTIERQFVHYMHECADTMPGGEGVQTGAEGERGATSVLGQVALDLPLAHAANVLLPFLTLGFDEPLVDVWPQGVTDHVVLVEHVQCLVEVARRSEERRVGKGCW